MESSVTTSEKTLNLLGINPFLGTIYRLQPDHYKVRFKRKCPRLRYRTP